MRFLLPKLQQFGSYWQFHSQEQRIFPSIGVQANGVLVKSAPSPASSPGWGGLQKEPRLSITSSSPTPAFSFLALPRKAKATHVFADTETVAWGPGGCCCRTQRGRKNPFSGTRRTRARSPTGLTWAPASPSRPAQRGTSIPAPGEGAAGLQDEEDGDGRTRHPRRRGRMRMMPKPGLLLPSLQWGEVGGWRRKEGLAGGFGAVGC